MSASISASDEAVASSAEPAPVLSASRPRFAIPTLAVTAAVATLVSCTTILVYHLVFASRMKVATIDLAPVLEASEVLFTEIVAKPGATDADRAAAYELVRQTGPKLDAAIGALQARCGCVLLARPAVIGNGSADLTMDLKVMMGVDHVDLDASRARLKALSAIVPPAASSATLGPRQ